ncbi:MAG: hypothetical protein DBX47_02970 [Clostridiales bacterium]|nr:MAG: hypothetical protein DBX47_02970 [Clostridiales bacterium]
MKNTICIVLLFVFTFIFSSCSLKNNETDETANELKDLTFNNNRQAAAQIIQPENGVYKDEYFKFQLTFPESWEGLFQIRALGNDGLVVLYFGESNFSNHYKLSNAEGYGLPLFYLGTEMFLRNFSGSVKNIIKIGTVGETSFYSFDLGDIQTLFYDVLNSKDINKNYSEEEIEKIRKDEKKCEEMLNQKKLVLETFIPTAEKIINTKQEVVIGDCGRYVNKELGVGLTFPETWKGFYSIQNVCDGCYVVCYTGKSNVSKYYDEFLNITGIPLFFIANDKYIASMRDKSYSEDETVKLNSIWNSVGNSFGETISVFSTSRLTNVFNDKIDVPDSLLNDNKDDLKFDYEMYDQMFSDLISTISKSLIEVTF